MMKPMETMAHRSRRMLLAAVAILAIVWTTSALCAAARYFGGTARLATGGEPSANLDREQRLHWEQVRGPALMGLDPIGRWLLRPPHNLALTLLVRAFGPMPGSYDGPYPTASQAWESLEHAQTSFRMRGGLGPDCIFAFASTGCDAIAQAAAARGGGGVEIRCAVFQERTLVIGSERTALLFDRGRGDKYAVYDFGRSARWARGSAGATPE